MSPVPLVSIILPTYNGARFLSDSIASCVAQTYQNWELVIVDDASTDRTPEIIGQWRARDQRILSVRNATNRKLPGSLNVGFSQAHGEFLTWTSDDNLFLPRALEDMAEVLQRDPNIQIVYADEIDIDAQGRETGQASKEEPERLIYLNCIRGCFLYRAGVSQGLGGYDETRFLAEDYDYWLRAYTRGFKFHHLRRALYKYRFHGESLTTTRSQAALRVCLDLRSRAVPQISTLQRGERAQIYLELAGLAWGLGSRGQLRRNICRAVTHRPALLGRRQVWRYLFYGLLSPRVAGWARIGLIRLGYFAANHQSPIATTPREDGCCHPDV
jgi:glycosyltransferase involved in cell wall biosynthesis